MEQGRGRMTQDLILGAKHDKEKKEPSIFSAFVIPVFISSSLLLLLFILSVVNNDSEHLTQL